MTEEKLVQQLDLFFMNLYDLPKPCAELIIPLRQRFIKNKSNIYDLSKLCVIGLAYKVNHAINSIFARDHGILQLIFLLPNTIEKIKLIKEEVLDKISKNQGVIVGNTPNKPVERKLATTCQTIIGSKKEIK
ncbi:hypothetical protein FXO37_16187 [Capsicum annuum]|nr:hypothetical protein FXO37_16187 [Capsicum annuum]